MRRIKLAETLKPSVPQSAMGQPSLKLSFLTFSFHAQCLPWFGIQGETKLSPTLPECPGKKGPGMVSGWPMPSDRAPASPYASCLVLACPLAGALWTGCPVLYIPGQRFIGDWRSHWLLNLCGGFSDTCATVWGLCWLEEQVF